MVRGEEGVVVGGDGEEDIVGLLRFGFLRAIDGLVDVRVGFECVDCCYTVIRVVFTVCRRYKCR